MGPPSQTGTDEAFLNIPTSHQTCKAFPCPTVGTSRGQIDDRIINREVPHSNIPSDIRQKSPPLKKASSQSLLNTSSFVWPSFPTPTPNIASSSLQTSDST